MGGTVDSYLTYYLAWIFFSYALERKALLVGLVVLLVLRRFIPRPGALFRLLGRARSLRSQVELNRANITARRDLAVIYLEGLRARAALPLIEEGLALAPDDPELLYLFGLALHRVGRHEAALAPLVRAVELDPRVRYGLPYVVAGDALAALKRWDGALDAYEHYLADNSSDVSGYTRIARAHARTGDQVAAREALREGIRTWGLLPSSMKRRQFGRYLAAQWARASVLHEPGAISVALALLALGLAALWQSYAPVSRWISESSVTPGLIGLASEQRALVDGFQRCGSQSTGNFAGHYVVVPESIAIPIPANASDWERKTIAENAAFVSEQYGDFEIRSDRIVSGTRLIQEFCLTRVVQRTPTILLAEAVWHEDVGDPGDASLIRIRLERHGSLTAFQLAPGETGSRAIQLKRE